MIYVIVLVLIAIFIYTFWRKYKKIKLPNVFLCSGPVKSGKSGLSVYLAVRTYKKNVIKWKIETVIYKFLKFLKIPNFMDYEAPKKPMLYSNIPLKDVKHNRFTIDILERRVRIPNKSVVLLDEVALIADSMLYKDREINAKLTLFVKLFGHYSHMGTLILNTQSIQDCHFAFKRCINSYINIHSNLRLPFMTLFRLQELYYSEDATNINANIGGDIEDTFKLLLVPSKYFRMYDKCCYSIFTDDLEYQVNYNYEIIKNRKKLKCKVLVSLQDWHLNKEEDEKK